MNPMKAVTVLRYFAICLVTISLASCGRSTTCQLEIDPAGAAAEAMSQLDTNSDGTLDEEELTKSALSLGLWDANQDSGITSDEVEARLNQFVAAEIGLTAARCSVTLDREPLVGATIVFEPESFMGDGVQQSTGITGSDGMTVMSIADDFLPQPNMKGIQPGLYLVRITHPEINLAEEYNSATTLTYECSPVDTLPSPSFDLSKK